LRLFPEFLSFSELCKIFFHMNKYKMSSVVSSVASSAHGARFFVCVKDALASSRFTAAGVASTGPAINTVVRDMGKTIRVPSNSTNVTGTAQRILRKVAIVNASKTAVVADTPVSSFVGFSEGGEDTTNVFYIDLYQGAYASIGL
jgi:hypothetical protein